MKISIIIPTYNEAEGIAAFHTKDLAPALDTLAKTTFEIIYVNDGSSDETLACLDRIAHKDQRVKIVNLSRNFGKEIAVTAGLSYAAGDASIIMDADGQHPSQLIATFIEKWQSGAQVVIGIRNSAHKEGIVKRWGSHLFHRLFNTTSGTEIIPGSTDFRLIDANVRTEFLRLTERHRITRGLIDWLGFRRDYVEFHSPERLAGTASYSTKKRIGLALSSFVSLSLRPLYVFGWIGLGITMLSLLSGIFIIVEQIIMGDPLGLKFTGSAMLGVFISFLVGLVLTSQGIIALYLSHIHSQTQARPLFVVDKSTSYHI